MTAYEEFERNRAETEELKKQIQVLSQQTGDFFLRRLEERKKFDIKKSLFRLKQMREEYDVLQKVEKQLEGGVKIEELGEERAALEKEIGYLEEEQAAEQAMIDAYLPGMSEIEKELTEITGIWRHPRLAPHLSRIQNIGSRVTEIGLKISDLDDEIAELCREIELATPIVSFGG